MSFSITLKKGVCYRTITAEPFDFQNSPLTQDNISLVSYLRQLGGRYENQAVSPWVGHMHEHLPRIQPPQMVRHTDRVPVHATHRSVNLPPMDVLPVVQAPRTQGGFKDFPDDYVDFIRGIKKGEEWEEWEEKEYGPAKRKREDSESE